MEDILLCNGVKMPQEGFGVFQIPPQDCKEVVLNAIRAGYRLLDTASSYKNEEAVGEAIREAVSGGLVKRGELFVTTKAYIQEMCYENLKEAFARSLEKLGLDYLDLYLIHMPLGDYYGAWRAMEELYGEGRIRAIGVCNFDAARLMDLCYNVSVKPMVDQIERHPHYQRTEDLAVMEKLGVRPEAWAPFAEGLKGMFTEPVLQRIAEKHGRTTAQVILRWNIQQGVAVIPKSVHPERMRENLAVWGFSLDEADMTAIAALDTKCPSMLDCSRPGEIDRLYDYLNNPVLTTL
ncbi:MAG TPA: aldo/keto reductase [Candidatus Eisenbergiella merdavium]|uniref:Aldo/keto reductase n=1 Tax=Candidatus Eisenbergiella merdavium TaxID=2838551 RepID=A0A9D2SQY1_9FIRM|nr:aldo/keto reductase [Candidatus Eisenbergiella merdavium]